jgi:hypothetical protein
MQQSQNIDNNSRLDIELETPPSPIGEATARLADRLGVEPTISPINGIILQHQDGRKWDFEELLIAFLDKMDEALVQIKESQT